MKFFSNRLFSLCQLQNTDMSVTTRHVSDAHEKKIRCENGIPIPHWNEEHNSIGMGMGMIFVQECECRKMYSSKIPIDARFQAQMNPLINSE